jgi:hypothetical protein
MAKAAIWRNETLERVQRHLPASLQGRRNWKSTASFNPRDLIDLIECAVFAAKWIREETSGDAAGAAA